MHSTGGESELTTGGEVFAAASDANGDFAAAVQLSEPGDTATQAVVWSVAEDGNDDGGAVESETGRPADVGFILK